MVGSGDAASIDLVFESVSPLYQGFFATPELVGRLGSGLGACVRGSGAVRISYSNEERIGRIEVLAEQGQFTCVPKHVDGGHDVSTLAPLHAALAEYRDAVAAAYDIRVASFKIGTRFLKGPYMCTVWAGGQYPPDGSTVGRCVDFGGVPHCGPGDPKEGVTVLSFADPEDQGYARKCFAY